MTDEINLVELNFASDGQKEAKAIFENWIEREEPDDSEEWKRGEPKVVRPPLREEGGQDFS